jgi:DNA-binding CsgD family transcriptional regulator
MNAQPQYTYADGSANRYVITASSLQYIPVKPEESSTGMYSGGDPAEINLTKAEFESLKLLLEKAIAATNNHIADRIKTSGEVTRTTRTDTKIIILKPGAPEQIALESALKQMLKK